MSAPNQTSLTLQFIALNIHAPDQGTGSCCLGDGGCAVTSTQMCLSGAWAADGACTANTCPASGGSAAWVTERAALLTQSACEARPYALYQGDGTACGTATCPPASGCCLGGFCQVLNQQACQNYGGTWQPPTPGWLGPVAACDLQPQYHHSVLAYVPDATGGTTQQPVVTPGVFTDTINVQDSRPVQSVELWLGLGLQRINDIRVRLTGPNGTTLDLVTRIGSAAPCTSFPIGAGYTMFDTLILQDEAGQTYDGHVLSSPPARSSPADGSGEPAAPVYRSPWMRQPGRIRWNPDERSVDP